MIKKENEVFITYDRGIMENSIDIEAFSSGFSVMMSSETMEFMEKILESQQNSINNQLENLSLVYFRIVRSIKFLKENLENINEYWRKLRSDTLSSNAYNNSKIVSVDWFKSFVKLDISDLENISDLVLDITREKIEDLNNIYIILNKIKGVYLKGCSKEDEEDNEKIGFDSLDDVECNDVVRIDVIKELAEYLPSNPTNLTVEDMVSKAEGMLFDMPMITFSFYLEIIDRYKNSIL